MRAARASESPAPLGQALGTREPGSLLPWLLLLPLVLLTVVAGVRGNGDVWLALTPALLALIVCCVVVLPLRAPMLTLLVLAWALEVPGDAFAAGLVQTPWKVVGALLFAKLNLTIDLATAGDERIRSAGPADVRGAGVPAPPALDGGPGRLGGCARAHRNLRLAVARRRGLAVPLGDPSTGERRASCSGRGFAFSTCRWCTR